MSSAVASEPEFLPGRPVRMTKGAWARLERTSERRHEWVGEQPPGGDDAAVGEVRPKDGFFEDGSRASTVWRHAVIQVNVLCRLAAAVDRDRVDLIHYGLASRTPGGSYYYPDLALAPRPPELERHPAGDNDFLLNPSVLIEIVAPPTARVDRGEKRRAYRTIPTVTDYLLIDQDRPRVAHLRRDGDGWDERTADGPAAVVALAEPAVSLTLANIYARVFPPA